MKVCKSIENIERILSLQKYPYQAIGNLERITHSFGHDLLWIATKAYCLGLIDGKRMERARFKIR